MADFDSSHDQSRAGWATYTLVGLNVLVAIAMVLSGGSLLLATPAQLTAAGAVDASLVWQGDVWRLLTACFVHVGIWHLALNMWVLLQVGGALEDLVGASRTALVYVVSGVFGFASSVVVQPRITAGASGAVFGIVGALLAVAFLVRKPGASDDDHAFGKALIKALVPFVVATLALGFVVPMIDNTSHVAGLLMGFLVTYGLSVGDRMRVARVDGPVAVPAGASRLGIATLCLCAVWFLLVVTYAAVPFASPRYHARIGLEDLLRGRVDQAKIHAKRASQYGPDDAVTMLIAARLADATAASDDAKAQARSTMQEGLRRLGTTNATDAFERATDALGLASGEGELPYTDARTMSLLCRAAIDMAAQTPAPTVKNDCAWLLLKTPDPQVHDADAALKLAQEAVHEAEAGGKPAHGAFVHTLACALAETGAAAEGLAMLEKLAVAGREDEVLPLSLDAERDRLKRALTMLPVRTPALAPATPTVRPAAAGQALDDVQQQHPQSKRE